MSDAVVMVDRRPVQERTVRASAAGGRQGLPGTIGADCVGLVEDDPAVRLSLARLLRCLGFAVVAFASAEALLACSDPGEFSVLLLDVQLVGMSGAELYAQLLADGCATPAVFMSGADHAREILRARLGEGKVLLSKPVDADVLQAALDHVLERAAAH